MKKIVFFDVDGTLVDNPTQVIPESAVQAIRDLRAAGHIAVMNTGRPHQHIDPRILAIGWDGIVAGCGMWVMAEGKVIHNDEPTADLCRKMLELVRKCDVDAFFEAPHGLVLDGTRGWCESVEREACNIRARGLRVTTDPDAEDFYFLKFVSYDKPNSDVPGYLEGLAPYFSVIDRGGGMKEMVPLGNTKSTGMERIYNHFGLTREDAYAFGDSTNDLPMFQYVSQSVAMGGGDPRLLKVATYVTDTVLNDGIQKGLRHLGLI